MDFKTKLDAPAPAPDSGWKPKLFWSRILGRIVEKLRRHPRPITLDFHSSPLLGSYVKNPPTPATPMGAWWADSRVKGIDYPIRLCAPGPVPTEAQIAGFESVIARLPQLIEASRLGPPPEDDGRNNRPPPFDIHMARIERLWLRADDSYFLIFRVEASNGYMLAPGFEISPDLNLLAAEWNP